MYRTDGSGEPVVFVHGNASTHATWSAVVAPYRATVDAYATEPTRILAIDAHALREHLASDPELAAELLPLVLESVSARLGASWQQLVDVFVTEGVQP